VVGGKEENWKIAKPQKYAWALLSEIMIRF
jgi:hypothetical protein